MHPYSSIDTIAAWKKLRLILSILKEVLPWGLFHYENSAAELGFKKFSCSSKVLLLHIDLWQPDSSWLDFVNEDLWRRLSTSTAIMLMADKADAGQKNQAAATAAKGLGWYGCSGSLDLPPAAFLPEVGSQRWRWPGGRCGARRGSQQQVSTTGGGQCGRYRGSSWENL